MYQGTHHVFMYQCDVLLFLDMEPAVDVGARSLFVHLLRPAAAATAATTAAAAAAAAR